MRVIPTVATVTSLTGTFVMPPGRTFQTFQRSEAGQMRRSRPEAPPRDFGVLPDSVDTYRNGQLTAVFVGRTLSAMPSTTDRPPVWLLDIDGVINAVAEQPDSSVWPAARWVHASATCTGVEWPLLAARPVLEFIRKVHRSGRAEIRWHTTWQHEAAGVARALGLPDFPVQPVPELAAYQHQLVGGAAPTGPAWWKLPAAQRVVGEGRALVWTDDDADAQLRRWNVEHPLYRIPSVLIICPRTEIGLTDCDLLAIDAFLCGPRRRSRRPRGEQPAARPDPPLGRPGRDGNAVARLSG